MFPGYIKTLDPRFRGDDGPMVDLGLCHEGAFVWVPRTGVADLCHSRVGGNPQPRRAGFDQRAFATAWAVGMWWGTVEFVGIGNAQAPTHYTITPR